MPVECPLILPFSKMGVSGPPVRVWTRDPHHGVLSSGRTLGMCLGEEALPASEVGAGSGVAPVNVDLASVAVSAGKLWWVSASRGQV